MVVTIYIPVDRQEEILHAINKLERWGSTLDLTSDFAVELFKPIKFFTQPMANAKCVQVNIGWELYLSLSYLETRRLNEQ